MLSLQIATGVTSNQPIKLVQVPQTTTYIPTTQPTIVSTPSSFKVCNRTAPGIKIAQYLLGVVSCLLLYQDMNSLVSSLSLQCKMPYFAVQHSIFLMPSIFIIWLLQGTGKSHWAYILKALRIVRPSSALEC